MAEDKALVDAYKMFLKKFRVQSFNEDWPFQEGCGCTPLKMAEAGWYHCPTDQAPDAVCCFMCHKELDGWEPEDDPWVEHKKHSTKCPLVAGKVDPEDTKITQAMHLVTDSRKAFLRRRVENLGQQFEEYAASVRERMENIIPLQ